MRHFLSAVAVTLVLVACSHSSRGPALEAFIAQLQQEGGLPLEAAACVAERFFDERTDEELKAFFERTELTAAERDEFARLGRECVPATSDEASAG